MELTVNNVHHLFLSAQYTDPRGTLPDSALCIPVEMYIGTRILKPNIINAHLDDIHSLVFQLNNSVDTQEIETMLAYNDRMYMWIRSTQKQMWAVDELVGLGLAAGYLHHVQPNRYLWRNNFKGYPILYRTKERFHSKICTVEESGW